MLRLRALPVLFALLLPLMPGITLAAPARHDPGAAVDWPLPLAHFLPMTLLGERHALPRVRLFMAEFAILPSGKFVTRTVATRPTWPGPEPDPGMQLLVLPLPATMPLFLMAAAGLVLAGRRRAGAPLAGGRRAA
jgi:hypothetical protein